MTHAIENEFKLMIDNIQPSDSQCLAIWFIMLSIVTHTVEPHDINKVQPNESFKG